MTQVWIPTMAAHRLQAWVRSNWIQARHLGGQGRLSLAFRSIQGLPPRAVLSLALVPPGALYTGKGQTSVLTDLTPPIPDVAGGKRTMVFRATLAAARAARDLGVRVRFAPGPRRNPAKRALQDLLREEVESLYDSN